MKGLTRRRSRLVGLLSFLLLFVWGLDSAVSQSKRKTKSKIGAEESETEMVEIRFSTRPRRINAKIIHGKDTFGIAPFVMELPKDSGFRDVRVVADGYITLNTRFHTFKNHKRVFKMVKTEDAHTMLGYKHLPPDAAVEVLDAGVASPTSGDAQVKAPSARTDKEKDSTSDSVNPAQTEKGTPSDQKADFGTPKSEASKE